MITLSENFWKITNDMLCSVITHERSTNAILQSVVSVEFLKIRHELQQTSYISVGVSLIQLQETSNIVLELYWTTFKVIFMHFLEFDSLLSPRTVSREKITVYKFKMT